MSTRTHRLLCHLDVNLECQPKGIKRDVTQKGTTLTHCSDLVQAVILNVNVECQP